jgi:hypothetical protein
MKWSRIDGTYFELGVFDCWCDIFDRTRTYKKSLASCDSPVKLQKTAESLMDILFCRFLVAGGNDIVLGKLQARQKNILSKAFTTVLMPLWPELLTT